MSTKKSTIDFLLDQLVELDNVRARKMFGEYALYVDDKVVGLVCDDQLFVKFTQSGQEFAKDNFQEGHPYPGAKPYMNVNQMLDGSDWLTQLLSLTAAELPLPKPKKPRKTKKSKQ